MSHVDTFAVLSCIASQHHLDDHKSTHKHTSATAYKYNQTVVVGLCVSLSVMQSTILRMQETRSLLFVLASTGWLAAAAAVAAFPRPPWAKQGEQAATTRAREDGCMCVTKAYNSQWDGIENRDREGARDGCFPFSPSISLDSLVYLIKMEFWQMKWH